MITRPRLSTEPQTPPTSLSATAHAHPQLGLEPVWCPRIADSHHSGSGGVHFFGRTSWRNVLGRSLKVEFGEDSGNVVVIDRHMQISAAAESRVSVYKKIKTQNNWLTM